MQRNERTTTGDETGWISMVDLLLMFLIVAIIGGMALAASYRETNRKIARDKEGLDISISILEDENRRLNGELGEYTPVIQGLQDKVRRLEFEQREFLALLESAGGDPREALERLGDFEARRKELLEQVAEARALAESERERADRERLAHAEASIERDNAMQDAREAKAASSLAREAREIAEADLRRALEARDEAEAAAKGAGDSLRAMEAARLAAEEALESALEARGKAEGEREDALEDLAKSKQELTGSIAEALGTEGAGITTPEELIEKIATLGDEDKAIRQSLIGLSGKIGRVVFVVDRSDSMNDGGRWEDAKRTVANWISHLPVEAAALVVFSGDADLIPLALNDAEEGKLELPRMTSALREEMLRELDGLSPIGITLTGKAMRQATRFQDADAIILFTDGSPEKLKDALRDPIAEVYEAIDAWRDGAPDRRVHSVGIGNYFNKRMSEFLLGVAERGGGVFIGR